MAYLQIGFLFDLFTSNGQVVATRPSTINRKHKILGKILNILYDDEVAIPLIVEFIVSMLSIGAKEYLSRLFRCVHNSYIYKKRFARLPKHITILFSFCEGSYFCQIA